MSLVVNTLVRSREEYDIQHAQQPPYTPESAESPVDAQDIDLADALAQTPNDMKTEQQNADERIKCICKCAIL